MKSSLSAAVLAATTLLAAGCSSEVGSADASAGDDRPIVSRSATSRAYLHSHNLPSHGVALEGYCPVAYFAVNKPVRGVPEHASNHNGVTYYFVSADAKKAFDAEPEKYLPAYGGWCAFGMAIGDKFPVDPRNFKIVDGRLFVFLKNANVDALELWNDGDEGDFTRKADAHWTKVQG